MNWFFTHNRQAINLDLVKTVTFTPVHETPSEARLEFTRTDRLETQAIILRGQDAAVLFRELYAHAPEI